MIGKNSMKHDCQSHLNMEYITNANYGPAKQVSKDSEKIDVAEYHDLHVQSDTLLLADVFEEVQNMCLEIDELDSTKFLSPPGLGWQAALKKTKVKLDLLTDIYTLLMVKKGIRGEICHSINMHKLITNIWKILIKKESSYIQYWYENNLYGWAMLQKLPVKNFEWIEDSSQFNKDFVKNYNEESDKGYSIKVDVQYTKKVQEIHNDLPFLWENRKIEKDEKLVANLHDKSEYVIHIKNLKQALNHRLVLKRVHRVIEVNQNSWLNPYIDMNINLRKKVKNDF